MVEFDINVDDKRWKKALPDYEKLIDSALQIIALNVKEFAGEVSILLTNDAEIQILNRDYRSKDKPTNVLSFPQDEQGLLGDIVLSLDTLIREANEAGKKLTDHFSHLLVHGALHLVGYDHNNNAKQLEMENLEIKLLAKLGLTDPYIY